MGTTVVLALFRGDRAFVAGIGDSRVYRLRNGHLDALTTDHSLAQALVGAGTIRPEEAENHKFSNVLYNYLGCKDARDGPDEMRMVDVRPGDRFLLACDGLTGVVRDNVIAEVLAACDDPQRAAQALTNRALENRFQRQYHLRRHPGSLRGQALRATAVQARPVRRLFGPGWWADSPYA